ncbi:MAG: NUDIX domain-containing protein [Clostridia bacterium]|nr:NUDIX domain-containing protein [Clostridia bacterium]
MRFTYCPDCGTKLIQKEIGDEGFMPYCDNCKKPLFDMFSSCIIALVANEKQEVALLRQNYISTDYYNLVSGYMKPGETAEETAVREVGEELGLTIDEPKITGTYWFDKKDMIMIGFLAETHKTDFKLSGEVDSALWIPAEKALTMVHPKGSVSHTLVEEYLKTI